MGDERETVAVDALGFELGVVLAGGAMSASDVAAARRTGKVAMDAPGGGKAWLEAGGVIVAEGKLARRRGRSAFVVTRLLEGGMEVEP